MCKSDKATLYTICFEGEDISEFEKFLMKFKDERDAEQPCRGKWYKPPTT